jgi:glyoxylase-like metal-dependent hydrolase (beta-lactamase superfamily II)
MNIQVIPTGAYQENCIMVWNEDKKALVFDPGFDAPLILQTMEQHQLEVVGYICTHTHADHINALAEVHRQRPAPIAVHSKDLEWAFESFNTIDPYYPVPQKPDVEDFQRLETAADWNFETLHFQCLETPGHTPGGCCLLFPESGILIVGDTLFKGSCGRTDLPGGNPRQLKESLHKLKQLPDEVRVFPGHGEDTTIGIERATNFYMQ